MQTKVLVAVSVIIFSIVGGVYYIFLLNQKVSNSVAIPTPTPTVAETSTSSNAITETASITVKDGTRTEKVIFHNSTGYTFSSYAENGNTDRIVASSNGNEILQLGVNFVGYTNGSLPYNTVVLVKNTYIGNLYRAAGAGTEDGGYALASATKLTGKCTENGSDVPAPCSNTDQISGKSKVFQYLPFCTDLESVAQCDELMSGLEIIK